MKACQMIFVIEILGFARLCFVVSLPTLTGLLSKRINSCQPLENAKQFTSWAQEIPKLQDAVFSPKVLRWFNMFVACCCFVILLFLDCGWGNSIAVVFCFFPDVLHLIPMKIAPPKRTQLQLAALRTYFLLAEGDYPFPSSYIPSAVGSGGVLPQWPLRAACEALSHDFGVSLVEGSFAKAGRVWDGRSLGGNVKVYYLLLSIFHFAGKGFWDYLLGIWF